MLKIFEKLHKFSERKNDSFIKAIAKRYLATLYTYPQVRKISAPFFSSRKPEKWVFLVGCYNSGTTICRDIIGMHPEIGIMPREGVRFTSHLPRPETKGWTRMWTGCPEHMKMPAGNQKKIADQIIQNWSPWWKKEATVFLEKSITNVTRMEWLDDNFDNAYFIGITRNAYPVIEGIKRRASPKDETKDIIGRDQYPIELVAQQWVDANSRLLEGSEAVKQYHEIKYEDLVANPQAVLGSLWHFLEVPSIATRYKDNILTVENRKMEFKNMNQASIDRLSVEEIESVNPLIKELQEKLGYQII